MAPHPGQPRPDPSADRLGSRRRRRHHCGHRLHRVPADRLAGFPRHGAGRGRSRHPVCRRMLVGAHLAGLPADSDAAETAAPARAGEAKISEDIDSADLSGVSGTPTFFINGKRHHGAYDIGTVSDAVRAARARAIIRLDHQPRHQPDRSPPREIAPARRQPAPRSASPGPPGRGGVHGQNAAADSAPLVRLVDIRPLMPSCGPHAANVPDSPEQVLCQPRLCDVPEVG